MTDLQQAVALVGGCIVILGAVTGWIVKRALPRYRVVRATGSTIIATLVGTDEIRHKITGEVLIPAQPGVGMQVAELTSAVARLTEHQAQTERLESRADDTEARLGVVERDVTILKNAVLERIASHEDSAAAWGAMAAAHRSTPEDGPRK